MFEDTHLRVSKKRLHSVFLVRFNFKHFIGFFCHESVCQMVAEKGRKKRRKAEGVGGGKEKGEL